MVLNSGKADSPTASGKYPRKTCKIAHHAPQTEERNSPLTHQISTSPPKPNSQNILRTSNPTIPKQRPPRRLFTPKKIPSPCKTQDPHSPPKPNKAENAPEEFAHTQHSESRCCSPTPTQQGSPLRHSTLHPLNPVWLVIALVIVECQGNVRETLPTKTA